MILYKYCDLHGIDILKRCRVKVTPPETLNYPMECVWRTEEQNEWDEIRPVQMHHAFLKELSKSFGIICFSEIPDSLLMWSHYATNHQGFVFGFETEKLPVVIGTIRHRQTL